MSNPGPATTVSAHPSNVTTNQTLRLIGVAKGVNLNAVGFTPVPVNNSTAYLPQTLLVTNVNNAGSAVALSTTTALSLTTTNVGSPSSLFPALTTAQISALATSPLGVSLSTASANTPAQIVQTLYADVTTASGATGTGDVYVYGYDFS
jgi:hypothetical protein